MLEKLALLLAIAGCVNWGLVGLFQLDLVSLYSNGNIRYANSYNLNIGYGVLTEGVSQLRDPFLDIRYRDKDSQLGQVEAWQNGLDQLRATFDEVARGDEDFGIITNQLHELFQSIEDLDTRTGIDNYDELVRAEMEREILFHAYQTMDKYDIEHVLDAVFNSKFKFKPLDTANTAAGSEECAAGAE